MKFRLLEANEIDVKVKQVTEKGAIALLYKTARTDMAILDETFGELNWTDDYKEIKGNLYCGIGVRESSDKPFVWKWDCGIESKEDDEGNQKKGEASDAFKRAGTKLGIGRELYTSPFIFLKVETIEDGKKFKLKDRYQTFSVKEIGYNEKREISKLVIVNDKNVVVYSMGNTQNKTDIPPLSHENTSVDKDFKDRMTYGQAKALKVLMKNGKYVSLDDLTREELIRLTETTKPEFEVLREGARLLLDMEADL